MKIYPTLSLVLILGLLLAACVPATQVAPGAPAQPGPTGEPVEKTIIVGPELVDCEGVGPQKCMQVKENPDDEYTLFYGQIEGFQYEEGNQYTLVVKEEPVENPPADAPSIKWTLVSILSKAPGAISPETQQPPATQPPSAAGVLEGPIWLLERYLNSSGQLVTVIPGSRATAEFKDGQVTGNASCNSYFASYQANGSEIQIGPAGMTEMACLDPEGLMDQESAYLAALQKAATYQVSAGKLEIRDAAGQVVLVYSVEQPASLTGVTWMMEMYNTGTQAVSSAIAGTQVTAIFGEDGFLGGSAGCNTYQTSYTLDGSDIQIGQPISTLMFCGEPEGMMDQEAAYLKALQAASSYTIEADRLTLKDPSGAVLVVFGLLEQKTLTDTDWFLSQYYVGGDAVTTPLAGSVITATFAPDGRLNGSAGCNTYSASYEMDGSSLKIGPVMTTKKACAEPQGVMEQEAAFLVILEQTDSYEIKGDRLILRDASGAELAEFTASDLVGAAWKWLDFAASDGSSMSPPDSSQYTVEFLPDGNLAIQADCNRATGAYTVDGSRLSIELGAVTLAMCAEGSLSQEFLNLLGEASSYQVQDEVLVIQLQNGAGSMQFGR